MTHSKKKQVSMKKKSDKFERGQNKLLETP